MLCQQCLNYFLFTATKLCVHLNYAESQVKYVNILLNFGFSIIQILKCQTKIENDGYKNSRFVSKILCTYHIHNLF